MLIGRRLARGGTIAPGSGATELMHRITLTLFLLLLTYERRTRHR